VRARYFILLKLLLLLLHPFNGPFSGTTEVSRYQKGKTNLDFTGARDSEWQWHQLGHMQVCSSLQTDNHASIPPLSFLQAGCPSCRPTNSVKALKGYILQFILLKDCHYQNAVWCMLNCLKLIHKYSNTRTRKSYLPYSCGMCKFTNPSDQAFLTTSCGYCTVHNSKHLCKETDDLQHSS